MRIFSAIGSAMLLSACSVSADSSDGGGTNENIACAIGNAADFSDECTVERMEQGDDTLLIIRHADGGFRRFEVLEGSGGLVVADGAEEATVQDQGTFVLVTVGADRYRIPVGSNGADEPTS
ncbi:hypothetical protein [Altererythrobacter sp. ZODW24]|uniref:hypothetical protein n=1 Tax=Altererythrobacter sp. ZODW24 TaxID=2185142 RepID=UPI0013B39714|nr:hypothetical protein [Altererythrobacter sp. ZODW24]